MEDILLRFDFKESDQENTPIQFIRPNKIFTTNKMEEVKPILAAIEQELDKGKYIAGYLSYEATPAFIHKFHTEKKPTLPLVWFASFDQPQVVEGELPTNDYNIASWQPTSTYQEYETTIQKIKRLIDKGETKQINFTTRLVSHFTGDPLAFYRQLLENQQASYSAYLDIGRFQILSASPELFFEINEGEVITKPMKGTIKRGRTLSEDIANKRFLLKSEKEIAENLMIVDILKEDLEKIAVSDSVSVPESLSIATYPTVHQMTSTVTARLRENIGVLDWFEALFPCGSITGAPKLETIEYIDQLETAPREVYCGAIGYITPERRAIFNVPIRTVVIDRKLDTAVYGVGGGITAASEPDKEYAEIQAKAAFLTEKRMPFSLLESILLTNGKMPYLNYHEERLQRSAQYFNYPFDPKLFRDQLIDFSKKHLDGDYKIRGLLNEKGAIQLEAMKIVKTTEPVKVYLSKQPIDSDDPFLYHKTTNRTIYQKASVNVADNFSTLLWNEKGHLTEFTIGNLVLKIDGQYLTPPIESGLLAGTFRQYLLDQAEIKQQILTKKDLSSADEIWLINAVRGWIRVDLVY